MIHEMIRIKYMVFRNANYKYIHGNLKIHTSTYTVWFFKYKYTPKPNTRALSAIWYVVLKKINCNSPYLSILLPC